MIVIYSINAEQKNLFIFKSVINEFKLMFKIIYFICKLLFANKNFSKIKIRHFLMWLDYSNLKESNLFAPVFPKKKRAYDGDDTNGKK